MHGKFHCWFAVWWVSTISSLSGPHVPDFRLSFASPMPLSNPIMNLKKHLHLQETMVFTIFLHISTLVSCNFPLMHNWGSQKTVVPTCKQTAHLACAFYPGLGCNLVSIGWFWIIDIDVSRNDYKNDASFNWCDLAFQGLYACIYIYILIC